MNLELKPFPNELIDALLADYKKPEDLIGQNGLLKQLTKALVERALQAELTEHLGHNKNQLVANESGNTRNGRAGSLRRVSWRRIFFAIDTGPRQCVKVENSIQRGLDDREVGGDIKVPWRRISAKQAGQSGASRLSLSTTGRMG